MSRRTHVNADSAWILSPACRFGRPVDDEISAHLLTDADTMVKAQQSQLAKCRKLQNKNACKKKGELKPKGKNELCEKQKRDIKGSCHRKTTAATGNDDALACCVLLTRLDEKGVVGKEKNAKSKMQKSAKVKKRERSVPRSTKYREPKTNQANALLMLTSPVVEPRRRRMASLNAEAVNSLLLYRDSSMMTNLTKKLQPSGEDALETFVSKVKNVSAGGKRAKKQKRSTDQAESIDWLSLFAPTPRRQASLTAETLLKLTSTQYKTKRQKKTEYKPEVRNEPTESTQNSSNTDPVCEGTTQTKKRRPHAKLEELKHRKQGTEFPAHPKLSSAPQGCCSLCQTERESTTGGQDCVRHAFQCGSSSGFPLNTIKEEQMQAEVTSCFCCSQERCVEYCHRLALFLEDKTFKEPEDSSLSEVHPDSSPSPIPPLSLCPRSSKRPKLNPSTGPQPSGIRHPVYCCTSVEACYGEPCRINGYSYSSVIPAITRGGCPFSPKDCSKCNQGIKRGKQTSACLWVMSFHPFSIWQLCSWII
ncbi:hypothetical protein GOODEAATRI_021240 [Goodea atripinnis]|uniref:Uncharacterized protein n=1 Tax=Goodea atripinnis TaxID=208336 RepID=A0ABV0N359_9TELE